MGGKVYGKSEGGEKKKQPGGKKKAADKKILWECNRKSNKIGKGMGEGKTNRSDQCGC